MIAADRGEWCNNLLRERMGTKVWKLSDVTKNRGRLSGHHFIPHVPHDIHLLPRSDDSLILGLAAFAGLLAGLAVTLLRVMLDLVGILLVNPGAAVSLILDVTSPERARLREAIAVTPWRFELVILASMVAFVFFSYGIYRQWSVYRHREETGGVGRLSRALFLAALFLGAVVFYYGLMFLLDVGDALGTHRQTILSVHQEASPWWLLTLALLGGTAIGVLRHRFPRLGEQGIPEMMTAVALRHGRMAASMGITFAGAALLSVVSGGSVGIEAPVVVFGAATASWLGQLLRVPRERLRVLAAAGAAAGIAACFNAPIAGAMFALEIVVGEFALTTFSPVVIASVLGTVVHRSIYDSDPVFTGVQFEILSGYEIGLYGILGLFCGLVATVFVKTLEWGQLKASAPKGVPRWLLPGLGLSMVVGLATLTGRYEVLGSGYDAVKGMQENQFTLSVALFILVGKIVCTALTLATGNIGGVFFPSIFIGAATGTVFGQCARMLFHDQIASPGAYSLIGMGAVVTAVIQAPLFGILMIFEMTNDYEIMLPLMVGCIVASLVTRHSLQMSLYQRQLKAKGIFLARGKVQNIMHTLTVGRAMKTPVTTVYEGCTFQDLRAIVEESDEVTFPLCNREEELVGVFSLEDLRPVIFETGLENLVVAGDLGTSTVVTVTPDDTIADAMELIANRTFEQLVVVDGENRKKVVGLLSRRSILMAYQRAVRKINVAME